MRSARDGVVVVAVPRTAKQPLLDRPLPQWSALARAVVLERAQAAGAAGHRDGAAVDGDAPDPALLRHVLGADPVRRPAARGGGVDAVGEVGVHVTLLLGSRPMWQQCQPPLGA